MWLSAQVGKVVIRGKVGSAETAEVLDLAIDSSVINSTKHWNSLSQIEFLEVVGNDTPNTSVAPQLDLAVEAFYLALEGLSCSQTWWSTSTQFQA